MRPLFGTSNPGHNARDSVANYGLRGRLWDQFVGDAEAENDAAILIAGRVADPGPASGKWGADGDAATGEQIRSGDVDQAFDGIDSFTGVVQRVGGAGDTVPEGLGGVQIAEPPHRVQPVIRSLEAEA